MTLLTPRRRAAACALLVSTLAAVFTLPLRAHADRGTARLASGGIVSGEIEVYIPGERVVIRTDSGEVLALDVRELSELQIVPGRSVAPLPPAPVPQAPSVPPVAEAPPGATYIIVPSYPGYPGTGSPYTESPPRYQLQEPERPPPGRKPSLFWPMMTLTGSAAAFVSGTMLMMTSYYSYCDAYYYDDSCGGSDPQRAGGIALMGLSLPLFILAATYLLPRKVRARRRHRAAQRGYQLSLVPEADPRTGHYGATATLRF